MAFKKRAGRFLECSRMINSLYGSSGEKICLVSAAFIEISLKGGLLSIKALKSLKCFLSFAWLEADRATISTEPSQEICFL